MSGSRPPRLARALLRLVPLGERRQEVAADLGEAFERRAGSHGGRAARRSYYRDVISVFADTPRRVFSRPRPSRWPADAAADLGYALRVFRRQPGAVAVAVSGLALAIAVGTSIFSLVYALALRPYGMVDPERVYRVSRTHRNGMSTVWAYGEFLRLRAAASSVDLTASYTDGVLVATSADEQRPSSQPVTFVADDYLRMLGATAAFGRLFSSADGMPGQPPAAVVSFTYWERRLNRDPTIVGRTVWLSGTPTIVVGVAARGIAGPTDRPPAFWLPLSAYETIYRVPGSFTSASGEGVTVWARLSRDVTHERAQTALQIASAALAAAPFSTDAGPTTGLLARLDPADDRLGDSNADVAVVAVLGVVLVVVALILLLACANVANLQLASATGRRREFGMRLALGAGRGRLVRQLFAESLLLGAAAGLAGLLLLSVILPVFASLASVPESFDVSPDLRVYLFLAAAAAAAGLGAGLLPARLAAKSDVLSAAQGRAMRAGIAERPSRLRSLLVGGQAAASILLLVLAALLTRAMVHISRVDVGFDADSLAILTPSFPRGGDRHKTIVQRGYFEAAVERARAVPGVEAATLTAHPPFGGSTESSEFLIDGRPAVAYWNYVSPNFFEVAGMRLVRGRGFSADESGERIAVVSESAARALWPSSDPIGQLLDRVPGDTKGVRVIGVVADAITVRLTDRSHLTLYRPMTPEQLLGARVMVRAAAAGTVLAPLERALRPLEPDVRVEVFTVADSLAAQLAPPRAFAAMASLIGAMAVALATIGLFGVTALIVNQRTREIGVRMAIGATVADVRRQMLRDSLRPVAIGLAIGLTLALLGGQFLSAALYGVSSRDPLAIAAAVGVLAAAAFAAVAVPVHRVARIDPARTLRAD